MRPVADRIALDASEAGLIVRTTGGEGGARLVTWRIGTTDPLEALRSIAAYTGGPEIRKAGAYEWERTRMEGRFVIPVAHLPSCYSMSGRVQGWAGAEWLGADRWDLGGVWLAETAR